MRQRGARLGQHFLRNPWAAERLSRAAHISADDTVLEIGPGEGALTRVLLTTGARVVAVEKDETLVASLHNTFQKEIGAGQLRLITDDVRNFDATSVGLQDGSYVLAANIPYYITGEIIRQFLTTSEKPRTIALLIQKEVAERIVARDGKESILSLSVKAFGTPRIETTVSRGHFSPPPSVDSAILVIEKISRGFFDEIREDHFFTLVKTGFSSKRKKLAGNLGRIFDTTRVAESLRAVGLDENVRAEDVPLSVWGDLAKKLT